MVEMGIIGFGGPHSEVRRNSVVDVNEQKILQLARQGNLQAVAVILNRHLIAEGVHIKVKANHRCLQVLLKAPEGANQTSVLQIIERQMADLRTNAFDLVKVYTPKPGTQTANLLHSFELSSLATTSNAPSQPAPPSRAPVHAQDNVQKDRASVASFLAQVNSLEELKALQNHPFFTGQCPQCGVAYQHEGQLPVYWDCSSCGWKDDLSSIMPQVVGQKPRSTVAEMKRLGNYLMEAGLLTESQINVALADQEITGMRLGEALARRGWVKEETIEYLMKKVILPERQQSPEIDLEVSRNLVKALLTQEPAAAPQAEASPVNAPEQRDRPNPLNAMPNERATLVLPDLDISEHLEDYLAPEGKP